MNQVHIEAKKLLKQKTSVFCGGFITSHCTKDYCPPPCMMMVALALAAVSNAPK